MSRYAKRHYEDTAQIINGLVRHHQYILDNRIGFTTGMEEYEEGAALKGLDLVADEFANLYEGDAPHFDRDRFLDACFSD